MQIREATDSDIPQISKLYFDTVHTINSKDYSPEQIKAWAPEVYPDSHWKKRWKGCKVFVAIIKNKIVGFAELRENGEIDCFYVHHLYQSQGIGSALMQTLFEKAHEAGQPKVFSDVSITAKAFFESQGFSVVKEQIRDYRGQKFKQYLMEMDENT